MIFLMNKLLTIASAAVLSAAVSQAVAETYNLSGTFTSPLGVETSIGGPNIVVGGSLSVGGSITTDTNAPGYSVTGGTVTLAGEVFVLSNISIDMSVAGPASDAGVLFNSGSICVTSDGGAACDLGIVDAAVTNLDFRSGAPWGYFTTQGMQLTGGAGGTGFTVAQPGPVTGNGPASATGAVLLLGNDAGIFLDGNITFSTDAPPPPVGDIDIPNDPPKIPTMPIYGLGLTILGLLSIAGRRLRKSARRK